MQSPIEMENMTKKKKIKWNKWKSKNIAYENKIKVKKAGTARFNTTGHSSSIETL